jgi:hypothetical protein
MKQYVETESQVKGIVSVGSHVSERNAFKVHWAEKLYY